MGKQPWRRLSRRGKYTVLVAVLVLIGCVVCVLWRSTPPQGVYLEQAGEVSVITDILPSEYAGRTEQKRHIRYLVIHETGNTKVGADAAAHNSYLHSEEQKTIPLSWHYTVDDRMIYHHLPDDEVAYHAGERNGNLYGIGIEICVNKDGDYQQALANGAMLCACLLDAYDLDLEDIKQHYDFSGKNCPENLRKNEHWQTFLQMVQTAQQSL